MAFPTIDSSVSDGKADSGSHTVAMPATVNTGILLAFATWDQNSNVIGWDTGGDVGTWTELYSDDSLGSTTAKCYYIQCDSGDASTNITVTNSLNQSIQYVIFALSGVDTAASPFIDYTYDEGNDANPDPPSETADWGSDDNLWFAVTHNNSGTNGWCSVWPDDTTDTGQVREAAGSHAVTAWGLRYDTALATWDPSTFTKDGSDNWGAATVVVKPTASGITETANQASETDTVQAIGSSKQKAVSQISETDTVFSILQPQKIAVGQSAETDTALTIPIGEAIGVGQISETDTPQSLTMLLGYNVIDLVDPITTTGSLLEGYVGDAPVTGDTLVAESHTSPDNIRVTLNADGTFELASAPTANQTISRYVRQADGTVGTEADYTVEVTATVVLGQVTETDTVFAINVPGVIGLTVEQAAEIDSVFSMTVTDAIPVSSNKSGSMGMAMGGMGRMGLAS